MARPPITDNHDKALATRNVITGGAEATTSRTLGSSEALEVAILDGTGTQITSFGGGTQYTEDAAAPANPTSPALQVRRRDTLAGETTTDGDWVTANGTDKGEVYVKHVDAIPVTDNGGSLTVDATSLPLPSGAATAANQTNGTQLTGITDGTNTVDVLKSDGTALGQDSLLAAGTYLSVPFTTTTAQAVASTDAGNYRWVSVHVTTQGTSSTVTFQSSNDNTNWVSTALNFSSSTASIPTSSITSAAVIYLGPLTGRYFRLNVTGISAGTTAGTVVFSTLPSMPTAIGGQVAQTGTWNVGSNAATGSAVPANAHYVGGINSSGNLTGLVTVDRPNDGATGSGVLATGGYIYNGTNFDRIRSIINAANSTGTGIVATGMMAQFDDTSPTAITENQFGNARMSANRNLYGTIRDAAGNERGLNITSRNSALVEGPTASGSSIAAAPVTTGGQARTTNPTAVADGQVVNASYDKLGKQVVVGSIRDLKSTQKTTITSSTSETTIVTAVASTFCDLYGLVIANTSASACNVTIKDSTAGTTRFIFAVPAGDTRGFMIPESAAHNQATVNTNWTATCSASVASIEITALFVKNI